MDHFGIGLAMHAMANLYRNTARRTGRTTSLLNSLHDGDRVICANTNDAARMQRLCRENGKSVECIAICPSTPERLLDKPRSTGRTIFDHTWVEQYYVDAIKRVASGIDELQSITSGELNADHTQQDRNARAVY